MSKACLLFVFSECAKTHHGTQIMLIKQISTDSFFCKSVR